jgi:hypothetical protein
LGNAPKLRFCKIPGIEPPEAKTVLERRKFLLFFGKFFNATRGIPAYTGLVRKLQIIALRVNRLVRQPGFVSQVLQNAHILLFYRR